MHHIYDWDSIKFYKEIGSISIAFVIMLVLNIQMKLNVFLNERNQTSQYVEGLLSFQRYLKACANKKNPLNQYVEGLRMHA
jgi:hypothetical protein